jgi:hypothetical protein
LDNPVPNFRNREINIFPGVVPRRGTFLFTVLSMTLLRTIFLDTPVPYFRNRVDKFPTVVSKTGTFFVFATFSTTRRFGETGWDGRILATDIYIQSVSEIHEATLGACSMYENNGKVYVTWLLL